MKYIIVDTLLRQVICHESGDSMTFDTTDEAETFAKDNIAHGFYKVVEDACTV